MKYIDVEKLITLLEQRKKQLAQWVNEEYANQRIDEINGILDVDISSLQQEQSEIDLKKEIEVCWETHINDAFGIPIEGRITKFEVEGIARHFYELGKLNARKEEQYGTL